MGDTVSIKEVNPAEGPDTYLELEAIQLQDMTQRLHPALAHFTECKELGFVKELFNAQRALLQCCLGMGNEWHRDCLLVSSTGSGKTLAFLLLVIHKVLHKLETLEDPSLRHPRDCLPLNPHCVIIVPSRELAVQIYDVARALIRHNDIWIRAIFGGFTRVELTGRKDIIICTPGRMNDYLGRGELVLEGCDTLVMDECDRLMQIEFFEQVLAITRALPPKDARQTIMCTATIDPGLYFTAQDTFLKERHFVIEVSTQNKSTHIVLPAPEDPQLRYFLLLDTLKHYSCNKVLIFCNTIMECKNLEVSLQGDGFTVDSLYRHKIQHER